MRSLLRFFKKKENTPFCTLEDLAEFATSHEEKIALYSLWGIHKENETAIIDAKQCEIILKLILKINGRADS